MDKLAGWYVRNSVAPAAGEVLAWDASHEYWRPRAGGGGISILDYGAVGDGATDSGAAINLALVAAATSGVRMVFAPAGTYILETPIVPQTDVWLCGAGWQATFFKIKGGNTNINAIDTTANIYRARLSDFCLDCNKANNNANGMGIKGWYDHSLIEWVWIKNCEREAIYLCPGDGYADTNYPADTAFDTFCAFIEIEDSDIAIRYTSKLTDSWFGPRINMGSTTANLYITSQGSPIFFYSCWFNGNPVNNIHMPAAGANINFDDCLIENSQQHNILITEPDYLTADHEAFITIQGGYIKNGNSSAGAFDAIHLEGDATGPWAMVNVNIHTTFINDVNTPRYGIYMSHVKKATINGCAMDAFGTDYFFVTGSTSSDIMISGNTPENYKVKSIVFADTPYTATLVDGTVMANATGGAITVTLPTASLCKDRRYTVIKSDASGNVVTADGVALAAQYDHVTRWSDGSNWYTV